MKKESIVLMGTNVKDFQWTSIVKMKSEEYDVKGVISANNINDLVKLEDSNDKIFLIGHGWKKDLLCLRKCKRNRKIWKDIIPEWGEQILKCGSFRYADLKKYTDNNICEIGQMFGVISELKPIATVFGNCQSLFLNKILENTDIIHDNYIICYFPFIQDMIEERKTGLSAKYLSKIDLFVYQNVSQNNKFSPLFETEKYILPCLKKGCRKVSIPFVYFKGYYPQYIPNRRNDLRDSNGGMTPYGDEKIQFLLEEGLSAEAVAAKLTDNELYTEEELIANIDNSLEELKQREALCDVVISDYIQENYRKERLFYSSSHPATSVLVELMKRVYKKLEIEDYVITTDELPENDGIEMIIYNSVKQKLGLEFNIDRFRFNRLISREKDSLCEYVKKYKEWNFPELSCNVIREHRSIAVSHLLKIEEKYIKERIAKKVVLSGRSIHINLYVDITADCIDGCIAKMPSNYAPMMDLIFPATVVGNSKMIPVTMKSTGEITMKINNMVGSILLVNIIYFLK